MDQCWTGLALAHVLQIVLIAQAVQQVTVRYVRIGEYPDRARSVTCQLNESAQGVLYALCEIAEISRREEPLVF